MAASTSTPMGTSSPALTMNPTTTEHDWRFPRRPDGTPAGFGGGGGGEGGDLGGDGLGAGPVGGIKSEEELLLASAAPSPSTSRTGSAGDIEASLQDLQLDFSSRYRSAHDELLRSPPVVEGLHNGGDVMGRAAGKGTRTGNGTLQTKGSHNARGGDAATATTTATTTPSAVAELGPHELALLRDPLMAEVWRFFTQTKQRLPHKERMENMTWRMMHHQLWKDREIQQLRYTNSVSFCRLSVLSRFLHCSVWSFGVVAPWGC